MEGTGVNPRLGKLLEFGGICAFLYILFAILVPLVLVAVTGYDFELRGRELLTFIGAHRVWWAVVQGLVLGSSVFLLVTLAALVVVTYPLSPTLSVVGGLFGLTSQVLFLAYFPVVNGLGYLSGQYGGAASPEYRAALEGGAEALIAMNNAYGPSDALIALGAFFFSLAMLRGGFSRLLAYLGIATLLVSVGGAFLKPVVGAAYLWWWLLFTIWLAWVGFDLWRLGRGRSPAARGFTGSK